MRLRKVALIASAVFALVVSIITLLFLQWLENQPDEPNFIDLVDRINDRRNQLSQLPCAPNLIGELELLVGDQELLLEQVEIEERENYYFDLINVHAKLGYLYAEEGDIETSEQHYALATVYVDLGSTNFDGTEFVRDLAHNSSIGCIP